MLFTEYLLYHSFICPFISQEELAKKEKERQQLIDKLKEDEIKLQQRVVLIAGI